MSTIAEFTIPATAFPLGSVFENHPGVTVELERLVPTNKATIPFCWVRGMDVEEAQGLEAEFSTHQAVRQVEVLDEVDGEFLLRVGWEPGYEGVMKAITETEVVLLSGVGTAEEWTFEIRAVEQEAISAFQEYCREHDLPIDLTGLYALSELRTGAEYDLTESQREALVLAYEQGYYRSPREITLEDLGGSIGITPQSFGSRLRRGTHRLIGSTLIGESG